MNWVRSPGFKPSWNVLSFSEENADRKAQEQTLALIIDYSVHVRTLSSSVNFESTTPWSLFPHRRNIWISTWPPLPHSGSTVSAGSSFSVERAQRQWSPDDIRAWRAAGLWIIHPSVSAGDLLPGKQHKIREFKIKFRVCVLGGEGHTVPHFYLCVNTTVPPQSPHRAHWHPLRQSPVGSCVGVLLPLFRTVAVTPTAAGALTF